MNTEMYLITNASAKSTLIFAVLMQPQLPANWQISDIPHFLTAPSLVES